MNKYTENDLKYPNNLKSVDWIKNKKEVIIENNVIVSDCDFYCKKPRRLQSDTINDVISFCMARYMPCQDYDNCYYKLLQKSYIEMQRLQEENEKIKKQYNCYACGNCKGEEDYINLEKHHKGLRKQFDEYVKRNYTLSLRIEELEKENEELKKQLEIDKNQINYFIEENKKLKEEKEKIEEDAEYFLNGDYCDEKCNSAKNELKYRQALEEIKELISD